MVGLTKSWFQTTLTQAQTDIVLRVLLPKRHSVSESFQGCTLGIIPDMAKQNPVFTICLTLQIFPYNV